MSKTTKVAAMRRRMYLLYGGTAAATFLAGCLSGDDDETKDDGDTDSSDPDELDPEATVERMLAVEDVESMADAVHSDSPIHPDALEADGLRDPDEMTAEEQAAVAEAMRGAEPPEPEELEEILEEDWELEIDADGPPAELESLEVKTDSATAEDILELEYAEFWFAEIDLDSVIDDRHAFVVDVELSYPDTDESDSLMPRDEPDVWILVSEGNELKYFWAAEEDTTPEDPEELFEEEVFDEDDDVVEEIDWDPEPLHGPADEGDGEEPDGEFEQLPEARVYLTDSPGIEANLVRAESMIAGGEISLWEPEDIEADDTGYVPGGWANSWMAVQYEPDGDQVVVTAITDDEEELVHRETFDPEE